MPTPSLGPFEALDGVHARRGLGLRKALDLLGAKRDVALKERNGTFGIFAGLSRQSRCE